MKKREHDKRGFRLWPQNVSSWVWYYEEPKGLCVIVQPRAKATGELLAAIPAFHIPWRLVSGSVDRYRKSKSTSRKRR